MPALLGVDMLACIELEVFLHKLNFVEIDLDHLCSMFVLSLERELNLQRFPVLQILSIKY